MKKNILLLLQGCITFFCFAQEDNPSCKQNVLPFFTTSEGFYVTDYCNYSDFGYYEFVIDRNTRSIKKEGVYREVWFRKKNDYNLTISGLRVLQDHVDAIRAAGGEAVKEADGSVFKVTYKGKEYWVYVNVNTNSFDLDGYGIVSIQVNAIQEQITKDDSVGFKGPTIPKHATDATIPSGGYPVHTIGELYGGGIVFFVYDNGQHGLIAATSDQAMSRWNNGNGSNTYVLANGINAGRANTAIILACQTTMSFRYAARECYQYSITGADGITYGDWYLPSKYELNLLFLQKAVVGNFSNNKYWCSNKSGHGPLAQDFSNGEWSFELMDNPQRIRAIRSF